MNFKEIEKAYFNHLKVQPFIQELFISFKSLNKCKLRTELWIIWAKSSTIADVDPQGALRFIKRICTSKNRFVLINCRYKDSNIKHTEIMNPCYNGCENYRRCAKNMRQLDKETIVFVKKLYKKQRENIISNITPFFFIFKYYIQCGLTCHQCIKYVSASSTSLYLYICLTPGVMFIIVLSILGLPFQLPLSYTSNG